MFFTCSCVKYSVISFTSSNKAEAVGNLAVKLLDPCIIIKLLDLFNETFWLTKSAKSALTDPSHFQCLMLPDSPCWVSSQWGWPYARNICISKGVWKWKFLGGSERGWLWPLLDCCKLLILRTTTFNFADPGILKFSLFSLCCWPSTTLVLFRILEKNREQSGEDSWVQQQAQEYAEGWSGTCRYVLLHPKMVSTLRICVKYERCPTNSISIQDSSMDQ